MTETLTLLIPICALSLVCVGLLAVAAILIMSLLGAGLPGVLGQMREFMGGEADDVDTFVPQTRSRRTNFRDQAADLDFDAAIARQQANKDRLRPTRTSTPPSPFDAQSADDATDFSSPSLRRRKRRRSDYSEDEIHGGLLDEDGDGDVDF